MAAATEDAGGRTAAVLGATGLVGGLCLELLLEDPAWRRVTAVVRRPTGREHPRLTEAVADFDRLEEVGEALTVDDVFCCLGSTIRKAGSQEAFYRIDHDYPVAAAKLASARGATRYFLVTAVGGDADSRVFYNRVKGEVERDVAAVPFEGVGIFRPSLILGPREERRPAESAAQVLMPLITPLLVGPLRKYRAVAAGDVARAMVRLAREGLRGVRFVESDEIARLGASGSGSDIR
jgi:uncharacterized protein YbjT (DUF2867 family)